MHQYFLKSQNKNDHLCLKNMCIERSGISPLIWEGMVIFNLQRVLPLEDLYIYRKGHQGQDQGMGGLWLLCNSKHALINFTSLQKMVENAVLWLFALKTWQKYDFLLVLLIKMTWAVTYKLTNIIEIKSSIY